jgi:hypothetical protein
MANRYLSLEDRLWPRVIRGDGCWTWTGTLNKGYGRIIYQGRQLMVHRVCWELLVGPIPSELSIDHLCRNKACCNPSHLEVVTLSENTKRAAKRPTHCFRGHEFSAGNTRVDKLGKRVCRACDRDRCRRMRRRGLDAALANSDGGGER